MFHFSLLLFGSEPRFVEAVRQSTLPQLRSRSTSEVTKINRLKVRAREIV